VEAIVARFNLAKVEYQKLLDRDFPSFCLDEYIEEKALEARQADSPKTAKTLSSTKSAVKRAGKAIASIEASEVAEKAAKIGKSAVGVQGAKDRKTAKQIREICGEYYDAAEAVTESKRQKLNYVLTDFGEYRLRALHKTVSPFLLILEELKQKSDAMEIESLLGADISTQTLEEMEHMSKKASEALEKTAIAGVFGAAAVLGIPQLVTGALATASIESTIVSLSGSAANSAILNWLGGGTLTSIGGGMITGTVALAAITAGATAVTTVLAAGAIVSVHYGKKLSEAKEYEKDVGVAVASLEKAWVVMDDISVRTAQLREDTESLKWRAIALLGELEPLVANFDFDDQNSVSVFNECTASIKSMADLACIPLLDDDGNLSK